MDGAQLGAGDGAGRSAAAARARAAVLLGGATRNRKRLMDAAARGRTESPKAPAHRRVHLVATAENARTLFNLWRVEHDLDPLSGPLDAGIAISDPEEMAAYEDAVRQAKEIERERAAQAAAAAAGRPPDAPTGMGMGAGMSGGAPPPGPELRRAMAELRRMHGYIHRARVAANRWAKERHAVNPVGAFTHLAETSETLRNHAHYAKDPFSRWAVTASGDGPSVRLRQEVGEHEWTKLVREFDALNEQLENILVGPTTMLDKAPALWADYVHTVLTDEPEKDAPPGWSAQHQAIMPPAGHEAEGWGMPDGGVEGGGKKKDANHPLAVAARADNAKLSSLVDRVIAAGKAYVGDLDAGVPEATAMARYMGNIDTIWEEVEEASKTFVTTWPHWGALVQAVPKEEVDRMRAEHYGLHDTLSTLVWNILDEKHEQSPAERAALLDTVRRGSGRGEMHGSGWRKAAAAGLAAAATWLNPDTGTPTPAPTPPPAPTDPSLYSRAMATLPPWISGSEVVVPTPTPSSAPDSALWTAAKWTAWTTKMSSRAYLFTQAAKKSPDAAIAYLASEVAADGPAGQALRNALLDVSPYGELVFALVGGVLAVLGGTILRGVPFVGRVLPPPQSYWGPALLGAVTGGVYADTNAQAKIAEFCVKLGAWIVTLPPPAQAALAAAVAAGTLVLAYRGATNKEPGAAAAAPAAQPFYAPLPPVQVGNAEAELAALMNPKPAAP